ncbi:hypothetical protein L914_02766 [Phytophthora nicotianae]|uniref:Uncharacterized protein n=1 Tax=Phytophthora nicotianae TaxID=4792 RepID=W2NZ27_PHYNI|nr:hypothetical protein L914_02766 [Phytophthora nicotianae]
MVNQECVRSSILQLLTKTSALNEMDVAFSHKTKPRPKIPLLQHNFCEEIMDELRLESYCGSPSTTTTRKNAANAVGYVDKKTSGPLDITSVWSLREGTQMFNTATVFRRFDEED